MNIRETIQKPFRYSYSNVTIILLVINGALFGATILFPRILNYLALYPPFILQRGFFWQPLTYMFMHSPFNYSHILFNMLGLLMFGMQLEKTVGSKEFLLYYLLTGILSGIVSIFIAPNTPMIGASAAIYAVLLAFATMFPDARILLFFIIPMRAPLAVLVFAAIAFFSQIFDRTSNVAHYAHLAGLVFGFFYFLIRFNVNPFKRFFRK